MKDFINAKSVKEIIFTKGTTEGINLVANCYSKKFLRENDEIIISEMEHHSNIVPWQMVCDDKKLKLKTIRVNENGELDTNNFKSLISNKTKFVSLVHISNSLGTINPIKKIINICKESGIKILIDGAQASPHVNIDVQELDCDFYVLSAHKMYGPTGIGVIYGKSKILNEIPPYMGGGEMIKNVTFNKTSYNEIPYKFEAGTPNIGDVIAFKEAIKFINNTGREIIHKYENKIKDYTLKKLQSIDGLKLFGNAKNRIGVFSFTIEKLHYYDLGLLLDAKGIAIRTGHHCTQPIMDKFKLEGTARISLAIYNSIEEKFKIEENIIKGCQSKVWLVYTLENNRFIFLGDSNTAITKGLLSLLIRIFSNSSPEEIINSNLFFIKKIGLNRFIGTQRSNGLESMMNKFKIFALSNISKNE